jgi:lysophospholipase L1-like esterase
MRHAPFALVALLTVHCSDGGGDSSEASDTGGSTSTGTQAGPTGEPTTDGPTGDPSSTPTGDGTTEPEATVTSVTSISTTGDDSGTGPEPTTGDGTTGEPPGEPAVHYVGRFDASDPAHVRMDWSGVGVVFRFAGTGASVRLDDSAGWFTVVVDGVAQPQPLQTTPGEQLYPLAQGLPDGEHTIELYRRTEGFFGVTTVAGVELEGELLPPPPVTRRIEIIGDSITCGYGNEGVSPCSFSADTENHYLTYGAVAARSLGAELSTVAWSGKGMTNNYDMDVTDPMPKIYDRLLASDPAPWSFEWQPDAVVINLGTNDFSTDGDPPENVFVPAYVEFVTHLREVYPQAFILVVAPSLGGAEAEMVAGYLQTVVDQRNAAGDLEIGFADVNVEWIGSGCDGHPTVATHAGMGAELTAVLKTELGW